MKAIILVAGYATRLYPLTLNTPKALLPINNRPIIDYIVDEIETIDAVDEIYVVSNDKFYGAFNEWKTQRTFFKAVTVLNDGTRDEQSRRGAIGDIVFTIQEKEIDDELLIVAGDNFFTYKLLDYYHFYKSKGKDCICVKTIEDKEQLQQFAIAVLDENNKVLELVEKPQEPKSDKAVFASYMYTKNTAKLFKTYIEAGNKKDAPGYFVEWLYKIEDVYAYIFEGECYDIGTFKAYEEVLEKYNGKKDS